MPLYYNKWMGKQLHASGAGIGAMVGIAAVQLIRIFVMGHSFYDVLHIPTDNFELLGIAIGGLMGYVIARLLWQQSKPAPANEAE